LNCESDSNSPTPESALNPKLFAQDALTHYKGDVYRVVESQEQAATLNLVDTMEEQHLLESLLDQIKPKYRAGTEKMHYLLKTAFRYPPLKYGSRFGNVTENSFFYSSDSVETALYETAYYRFIFLNDLKQVYNKPINSEHSIFSVSINSSNTLDLTAKTFASIKHKVTAQSDYAFSQAIGTWATSDQVAADCIRFHSARFEQGVNYAVAEPAIIESEHPKTLQRCFCQSTSEAISFKLKSMKSVLTIQRSHFMQGDHFPQPA
jgi:hypothetical protein